LGRQVTNDRSWRAAPFRACLPRDVVTPRPVLGECEPILIERTLKENARILSGIQPRPRNALEIGALPSRYSVLSVPAASDIPDRIGVNLVETGTAPGGVEVVKADARALPFADGTFDLVVAASVLEHIPDFWRAVTEMQRVLGDGGTLLVSTPGFRNIRGERRVHQVGQYMRFPDIVQRATLTMRVHDNRDYYRFSEDSYREVILAGLVDVRVWSIMLPPRMFGVATKPAPNRA
jgi:SAM-dependent methyltransferase